MADNKPEKKEYIAWPIGVMHDNNLTQAGKKILLTDQEYRKMAKHVVTPEEYKARTAPKAAARQLDELKERVAYLEGQNKSLKDELAQARDELAKLNKKGGK